MHHFFGAKFCEDAKKKKVKKKYSAKISSLENNPQF
jgi:hypothetical protein